MKPVEGTKKYIFFKGEIPLKVGPLERGWTVVESGEGNQKAKNKWFFLFFGE